MRIDRHSAIGRPQDPVKGVVFDLDGTLYRMRFFMRPLLFVLLLPHSLRLLRFLSVRSRFAGVDMGSRDALMDEICAQAAKSDRHTSAQTYRLWVFEKFYPAFLSMMPLQRSGRPGCAGMLRTLHDKGIKLAVLSDFNEVRERLELLRLPTDCFDIMTSSEIAGALKPSPGPFLQIAETWGFDPSSILVVGDRDDTDGAAARSAKMRFLLLGDQASANAVQSRPWNEVRAVLEGLRLSAD